MKRTLRLVAAAALLTIAGAGIALGALYLGAPVPELRGTWSYQPQGTDSARETGLEKEDFLGIDSVSAYLLLAVLLSEDHRFAYHDGLDFEELGESISESATDGRQLRGASTISQQLVKNVFLDHERRLSRKVVEAVYATRLERALEKSEILALYLDVIELGDHVYGVAEASQLYFGSDAADVDVEEAVILAALLPDPKGRSPMLRSAPTELIPYLEPRLFRMHRVLLELEEDEPISAHDVLEAPLPEIVARETSEKETSAIRARVQASIRKVLGRSFGPPRSFDAPFPF